jgi:hypothetical protein
MPHDLIQPSRRSPVTVSREELYKQVWETPMSGLARTYGISRSGLAKVCSRLKVPYPPRGYWAKKAAGKKVIQYRLPEREEGTPKSATITPTPPPAPPPEVPPEVQRQVDAAKSRAGSVLVPVRLAQPHPVIAGWLREREEERERARRKRDPWLRNRAPTDWTASERRRHRILDALFKSAERQGIRVKQPDRFTVYLEASGERVDFKLREKQKQVRVQKSPDEMKRLLPGEKTWRQELQPSGLLAFSIETYLAGLPRRTWNDTTDQPLEEQVGDILAGLLLAGPMLVQQRREREEAEQRRREEERRRYEAAERKRLDDNRWRRFVELAARWRQTDEARRFLTALEQHPDAARSLANGDSVSDWLAWAQVRLVAFDPLVAGPTGVFEDLLKITSWTYRE